MCVYVCVCICWVCACGLYICEFVGGHVCGGECMCVSYVCHMLHASCILCGACVCKQCVCARAHVHTHWARLVVLHPRPGGETHTAYWAEARNMKQCLEVKERSQENFQGQMQGPRPRLCDHDLKTEHKLTATGCGQLGVLLPPLSPSPGQRRGLILGQRCAEPRSPGVGLGRC